MKRVRLALAARGDISEGSRYIARDSPQASLRWQQRLQAAFKRLAEHPGSGHPRPNLADNAELRFWRVDRYLVVYRCRPNNELQILRVLHGSRDIAGLLQDEPPTDE